MAKNFTTQRLFNISADRLDEVYDIVSHLQDITPEQITELRYFKRIFDGRDRAPFHDKPIFLDYLVKSVPRYGHGKPAHPELLAMIEAGRDGYRQIAHEMLSHAERFAKIPVRAPDELGGPNWVNGWIPALDTMALYTMIGRCGGKRYLEVGSGNSTRFARRAIRDLKLPMRLISIDPEPRAEIDAICDEVIRAPLETCDLSIFGTLEAGDVLFIDNSHRCFMNSDVTICFLEILPRLRPGVLVQIHDICLPYDYPPEWASRHYSEQYLLACYLLGGGKNVEILLPNAFFGDDKELGALMQPLFQRLPGVETRGLSFWLRTR